MEYYKNLSLEDLFYIDDDGLVCCEEWRYIPDYIGLYQASNLGRIKSMVRMVKHNYGGTKTQKSKILKQSKSAKVYLGVGLSKQGVVNNFLTQILVAMAFLDFIPCNSVLIVDHINNKPYNNTLSNLQITTKRVNNTKDKKPSSSKHTGVIYRERYNHWRVTIKKNIFSVEIGTFKDEDIAGKAYTIALNNLDKYNGNNKEFRALVKSML